VVSGVVYSVSLYSVSYRVICEIYISRPDLVSHSSAGLKGMMFSVMLAMLMSDLTYFVSWPDLIPVCVQA